MKYEEFWDRWHPTYDYGTDGTGNTKGKISFNETPMHGLGDLGKW